MESSVRPSALGQAATIGAETDAVRRQIRQLTELLSELRRQQRAWEKGGQGEQAVIRVLVGMDARSGRNHQQDAVPAKALADRPYSWTKSGS